MRASVHRHCRHLQHGSFCSEERTLHKCADVLVTVFAFSGEKMKGGRHAWQAGKVEDTISVSCHSRSRPDCARRKKGLTNAALNEAPVPSCPHSPLA